MAPSSYSTDGLTVIQQFTYSIHFSLSNTGYVLKLAKHKNHVLNSHLVQVVEVTGHNSTVLL